MKLGWRAIGDESMALGQYILYARIYIMRIITILSAGLDADSPIQTSQGNDLTTIRDLSHRHFAAFADWIRPEMVTRKTIVERSAEIRSRIKGQAETDGLTVRSMPDSGS